MLQRPNGSVVLGGSICDEPDIDVEAVSEETLRRGAALIPALSQAKIKECSVGYRPFPGAYIYVYATDFSSPFPAVKKDGLSRQARDTRKETQLHPALPLSRHVSSSRRLSCGRLCARDEGAGLRCNVAFWHHTGVALGCARLG
jgi:hypothetical protein